MKFAFTQWAKGQAQQVEYEVIPVRQDTPFTMVVRIITDGDALTHQQCAAHYSDLLSGVTEGDGAAGGEVADERIVRLVEERGKLLHHVLRSARVAEDVSRIQAEASACRAQARATQADSVAELFALAAKYIPMLLGH